MCAAAAGRSAYCHRQVALLSAATALPALPATGDASITVPTSLADLSSRFYSEDAHVGDIGDSNAAVGATGSGKRDKLGPGAVAGITIASVLVAGVLLALAAVLGVKRYKKHRMGWRKDDLNGDVAGFPPIGSSSGLGGPFATVSQLPPHRVHHVLPVTAYPSGSSSVSDGSGAVTYVTGGGSAIGSSMKQISGFKAALNNMLPISKGSDIKPSVLPPSGASGSTAAAAASPPAAQLPRVTPLDEQAAAVEMMNSRGNNSIV